MWQTTPKKKRHWPSAYGMLVNRLPWPSCTPWCPMMKQFGFPFSHGICQPCVEENRVACPKAVLLRRTGTTTANVISTFQLSVLRHQKFNRGVHMSKPKICVHCYCPSFSQIFPPTLGQVSAKGPLKRGQCSLLISNVVWSTIRFDYPAFDGESIANFPQQSAIAT